MNEQRNIKLTLAFDGTAYCGWQRQKGQPSIQQTVEEALARMTSENEALHGAGRTDAGVHALAMTASFFTRAKIPCPGFVKGLNSMLPPDIRVLAAKEVAPSFHARRSAIGKTYGYNIARGEFLLPTERLYAVHVPGPLDIEAMRQGAALLVGEHDFSCFEAAGSRDQSRVGGRGAVRTISEARLEDLAEPPGLRLMITGDGFLRHMVRNIVATLLWVGQGRLDLKGMAAIIRGRDRQAAPPTAPPQGLFLVAVHY